MPLVDAALSSALQAIDAAALAAAKAGSPWTSAHYFDEIAKAHDNQTKTATITVTGTAVGAVSGGPGVPVSGTGTPS